MKPLMRIRMAVERREVSDCRTDLLAIGRFSGTPAWDAGVRRLDARLKGALSRAVVLGDVKTDVGSTTVVYGGGGGGARRVLIVGMGDPKKADLETLRKAAGAAAAKAVALKVGRLSLALHRGLVQERDPQRQGRALAEGAWFGAYRYDEYVTGREKGPAELRVEVIESEAAGARGLGAGVKAGEVLGQAATFARTLANRPGNVIHPEEVAAEARKVALESRHLTCRVWREKELRAMGMGGLVAVGSGSVHRPCLVAMRYAPRGRRGGAPGIGLVGKAVTFDSGGISIKPAADMDQMKFDKSGGLAVLATMKAIDRLGLNLDVLGLIPAAENLPSGSSYRPGDIVTTYSGKTVEILNTDAEGRMILCDALAYAVEQGCERIVDIATLTGACVVALGKVMAGLMGNDDGLVEEVRRAAEESGERVWPMPCGEEYAEEMKSKIADLKNAGSRWGGACTAAAFLRQFAGNRPWAHLDIAGVDVCPAGEGGGQGASGFGVRLLTTFLMHCASAKRPR